MGLAERIKEARERLPTGQDGQRLAWTRLETDHQISRGTFSRILRGEQTSVTNDVAQRIADALGVSVGWLLAGDSDAARILDESGEVATVQNKSREAAVA